MELLPNKGLGFRWVILDIITLPLSVVFYLLMGIHNGIEWLYNRLAGEK